MRHNLNPRDAGVEQLFVMKALPLAKAAALRERCQPRLAPHPLAKRRFNIGDIPRDRDEMQTCLDDVRVRILKGNDPLYRLLGLSVASLRHYFMQVCAADYNTADLLAHAAAELASNR